MYDAKDYDDYFKQIRGCNFLKDITIEQNNVNCYSQNVIDDSRVETAEYTGLSLYMKSFTSYTKVNDKPTTIEIIDGDGKSG